jgi:hypothetical protein
MAMVMLVAEIDAGEPVLGPNVAERLGSLGITRVTLLRDLSSTAVVLEGWAFDPSRTDEAIRAVFPVGSASLRKFHEVQQVGVSAAQQRRETQRHPISSDPVSSL